MQPCLWSSVSHDDDETEMWTHWERHESHTVLFSTAYAHGCSELPFWFPQSDATVGFNTVLLYLMKVVFAFKVW